MQKIHDDTKKLYIENPVLLDQRIFSAAEWVEEYLKEHSATMMSKEVFSRFNKLWEIGKSYWIFPETEDYKKLVQDVYDRNKNIF